MILSIILLFIGLFIIFYLLTKMNSFSLEKFEVRREIRSDSIDSLHKLSINSNIVVGERGESILSSTTNSLATNNTIFIKNGVNMGTEDSSSGNTTLLDLDLLRKIKNLPYNLKDQICLGSSCINKHHIKVIKGKKPFKLNTFITAKPFRIFSEKGYGGWARGVTTYSDPNINLQGNGVKSVRISDPNYIMTAYEKPNYQGTKIDIGGEGTSDVTGTFPNGFKSYQARSSSGNLLKNYCFSDIEIDHAPDGINNVIQAVPCDQSTDVFYINRQDDVEHKAHGDSCDVDFHVHMGYEAHHHDEEGCTRPVN